MYRQVLTTKLDSELQKILYRFNKNETIKTYKLKTVTYGLAPSSFLATRTLSQLAEDEGEGYPLAKRVLQKDFYIDDAITGAESIEQAIKLRTELDELLRRGGFVLRKWCSNSLEVLKGLSSDQVANESTVAFQDGECIKTLGISWEPKPDTFKMDTHIQADENKFTKRSILSEISQLFDPLGLVAPVILKAKIIMQQLWALSLNWDEEVPSTLALQWKTIREQHVQLSKLRIPRFAFLPESEIELHCFADASTLGYGACVYARSENSEGVKISLLTAKSRVAPLKRVTLPRLELCAALLGAQLFEKATQALEMKPENSMFWSDSTVVLQWLKSSPHNWKTYVANRVSEIQSITHQFKWAHISGLENPADLVSRGLYPTEIVDNRKWYEGPEWLAMGKEQWPYAQHPQELPADIDLEIKVQQLAVQVNLEEESHPLFVKWSSYNKLIHIVAYCQRFIHNACNKANRRISPVPDPEELWKAAKTLARIVQKEKYSEEIKGLKSGKPVSKHSKLRLLNPFIDNEGIIRVGGRLNLSMEVESVKHPIIIPGFHPFTKLLLTHQHRKLFHGGTSLVLSTVRDEFWPINGRRAIRGVLRTCYECFRANPKAIEQPIGQIPASRITPGPPFFSTGVDYCGPVFIKSGQRKATTIKAYIAIFVCFTTKAVHIELVSNLSTDAFMAALRRFIARRGLPRHIYSDNGTNFIGAKNELHSVYQMLNSTNDHAIRNYLSNERISWHLIPPRAPNFGGLWEAAVKVAKTHLLRQIGNTPLFHEDLVTLLTQIEACMNSRPLTALSEDSNNYEALTPGHFLIGSSLHSLPEVDVRNIAPNRLNHFESIQQKVQHFWERWSKEYLRGLNRQSAINPANSELKVGQLVVLQDHLLPPRSWPLARIEELHPGPDAWSRCAPVRQHSPDP